jgi:hypothetical protein
MQVLSKEGLGPSPKPQRLYVDRGEVEGTKEVYGWYALDDNNVKTPVFEPALTGTIQALRIVKTVFNADEILKLDITVHSGRTTWIVRSGVETTFTRGIVLTLAALPAEAMGDEFVILAEPADKGVYGSLYEAHNGAWIPKEWDKGVKLFPIINRLREVLGEEPQTIEQIRQDYADRQDRRNAGR